MGLKILYIAEIVGKAGVFAVKKVLPQLKREKGIDFVIAGADGVTGGSGLGRNHAVYLRKLGIDVLVMGECAFYKKDIVEHFQKTQALLRPANYPAQDPGRGWKAYECRGSRIVVASLLGQAGFSRTHLENPFLMFEDFSQRLRRESPILIVDFHAATTAEKRTLFAIADGKASALIGSHTRVATADYGVSGRGTAYVTDAGRTGSAVSVGGLESQTRIEEYMTGIPDWSHDAWDGIEFQALLLDIDPSGKARSMERIRVPVETPHEEIRQGDRADALDGED
jgi:metallophosphoesterase (TIGR00282 family)